MRYAYTTIEYALAKPWLYQQVNGEWPDDPSLLKMTTHIEESEILDMIETKITVSGSR